MSNVITYASCFRCGRFFVPTPLSPTARTVYCSGCRAASTSLSDTPPPPIPATATQTLISLSVQFNHVEENDDPTYSYVPCPTPAARSVLNTLKKDKLSVTRRFLKQMNTSTTCAICSDEFNLKESVNKLPCRHWFHHDCIGRWLTLKNNCPLCRHEFPREPEHHISRSPVPEERPNQTAAAAATMIVENSTERVVQALSTSGRVRFTARIRAGGMLPNRRLAER